MSKTFKVAAVQAPPGQIDGPVADLDQLEALTARAAGQGARLVAWPECAYPAYFLRSAEHYRATAGSRPSYERVLARLAEVARRHRVHLVAGVVEERDDGRLSNAAMLFDPSGRRLLTYRKTFLWHFDNDYFVPGDEVAAVQTELGRIGLMICADGRCPELAAIAGRQGVQLLVNPTAWVSWGRRPAELTNPQIEFFIPARAMETGCWILSANKVGVEADSIVYCGRSNLVAPSGETAATLDSEQAGVLTGEVDLSACRAAAGPGQGQADEPGSWPAILFKPTASLPAAQLHVEPPGLDDSLVAAVVAGPMDRLDPSRLLADLNAQSVRLVVASGRPTDESVQQAWVRAAERHGMILALANRPTPGRGVGRLRLARGPVESFAPARAGMLDDATVFVAAPAADGRCPDLRLLRARAAENRIYVVAAAADRAVIVSPAGAVLADSLDGRAMAVVARLTPAAARDKLMAPGTDVVNGRDPALYARHLR